VDTLEDAASVTPRLAKRFYRVRTVGHQLNRIQTATQQHEWLISALGDFDRSLVLPNPS
jgi:hypothetical protein